MTTSKLTAVLQTVVAAWAAAGAGPPPRPVPDVQAIPLPHAEVSFQLRGNELARYHYGADGNRPFVFPVNGPSGRSLTRMGHPHDPESHSHHNSVWISHHDVDGLDFWSDRGTGRIVHQRVERFDDGPESGAVRTINHWITSEGRVLLRERRLTAAGRLDNGTWILLIDLLLEARNGPRTLGKTPFGLIGVRMAKSIGVNDGGGTIRNSEGGVNEAEVFWKRARWVDYSGPITATAIEGLTLMDHPANPNHPSVFHVRNDGWMGSSLTHDAPRVIEPGTPLRLRYGLYVHAGTPPAEVLDRRWQAFSKWPLPDLGNQEK